MLRALIGLCVGFKPTGDEFQTRVDNGFIQGRQVARHRRVAGARRVPILEGEERVSRLGSVAMVSVCVGGSASEACSASLSQQQGRRLVPLQGSEG